MFDKVNPRGYHQPTAGKRAGRLGGLWYWRSCVSFKNIRPLELYEKMTSGEVLAIVDVRTAGEYAFGHATGAVSLPLHQISPEAVLASRPEGTVGPTYIICQSGGRSEQACRRLVDAGIKDVVNVDGGTAAWRAAGLPVEPRGSSTRSGLPGWVRIIGILLVLACMVLSWLGQPWFALVGLGVWMAMIVGGRGACPLKTCSTPAPPMRGEKA
jgi:rhodanese-related sulfurtransferase